MKKENLIFDYDNTMAKTIPLHITYLNNRYDIQTVVEDYKDHPRLDDLVNTYLKKLGRPLVTDAYVYEDIAMNLLNSIKLHKHVEPSEGLCEILPRLAKKYNLYIATARNTGTIPVIEDFIARHVPGCISGIHCVYTRVAPEQFIGVPKRDFIASLPGTNKAFIDNSVKEILRVHDIIDSYLFDPEENHSDVTEIISHVKDLYEFEALLE